MIGQCKENIYRVLQFQKYAINRTMYKKHMSATVSMETPMRDDSTQQNKQQSLCRCRLYFQN